MTSLKAQGASSFRAQPTHPVLTKNPRLVLSRHKSGPSNELVTFIRIRAKIGGVAWTAHARSMPALHLLLVLEPSATRVIFLADTPPGLLASLDQFLVLGILFCGRVLWSPGKSWIQCVAKGDLPLLDLLKGVATKPQIS